MQELKKIGVLSAAKISTLVGLFAGIVMTIYLWALYTYAPAEVLTAMGVQSGAFGLSAAAVIILFQVVVYFLLGIVGALLYNGFAKMVGGVKFNLVEVAHKKKK